MATPFFHISSTNSSNTSSTTTSTTTTTNRPLSNPNSSSNSKPRGRKHGGKSQNGPKNKIRQRGVGIAELERIIEQNSPPPPPHHHDPTTSKTTTSSSINAATIRPFFGPRPNPQLHHSNPLSGVPVIRYCYPGQPVPDPRLTHRFAIPDPSSSPAFVSELPSMPNPYPLDFSTLSFKKKRVIGEETSTTVGFSKGYNGNFGGFDLKNGDNDYLPFNGGFSAHATTTTTTASSEVVAIHRKWNGSENVMMEYGFFPGKSSESNIEENMNNFQDYNYYNKIMEDELNLKMGLISDSSSSPSSSSSLSSLTTATTTTTSNTSVDLSLKLSYH